MNSILDISPVNAGRQLELDIARGLAVLFMIAVHAQEMFALPHVAESLPGQMVEFFGGPPAAPVFMFLLGAGIIYSKKALASVLLKRGMLILLAGYLLNFLRSTLPNLLVGVISSDPEYYPDALYGLLEIDILQFAGLALILFGIVRALRLGVRTLAAVALLCAAANLIIGRHEVHGLVLPALAGLLWGASSSTYFPFLTWIAYPVAGYLFATYLIRCRNKDLFYGILTAISVTILYKCAGLLFGAALLTNDDYDYYHHNALLNIVYILFVLAWLGLLHFATRLVQYLFPRYAFGTLRRWSANVAEIYFIHWCLLGWLAGCFYFRYEGESDMLGYAGLAAVAAAVAVGSDALAFGYRRLCAGKPPAPPSGSVAAPGWT